MRDEIFANQEYYHIYNRGVDKRKTFLNKGDYFRFLYAMDILNTEEPVCNLRRFLIETKCRTKNKAENQLLPSTTNKLVEIVAYCLMPNHFHILLKQLREDGVSKYMQKLLISYTKYFNIKYDRSGVLFQGVFQSKHVNSDPYLLHLSRYLHLNPLDLVEPNWENLPNIPQPSSLKFVENYPWSSFRVYTNNVPNIVPINTNIVLNSFSGKDRYKDFVLDWATKNQSSIFWSTFRFDQNLKRKMEGYI